MTVRKLNKLNFIGLCKIADILYACGRDMAKKYELHHWDNSHIKTLAIVFYCAIKNKMYLVYEDKVPIATFQVRKSGNTLLFQKLAQYEWRGVGSFCINEIETMRRDLKCTDIDCEVYSKSEHAIQFYEHKGYCRYDVRKTLKYEEILMKKTL